MLDNGQPALVTTSKSVFMSVAYRVLIHEWTACTKGDGGSLFSSNRPNLSVLIAVFQPFLAIFLSAMCSSFTKLRFRQSF